MLKGKIHNAEILSLRKQKFRNIKKHHNTEDFNSPLSIHQDQVGGGKIANHMSK